MNEEIMVVPRKESKNNTADFVLDFCPQKLKVFIISERKKIIFVLKFLTIFEFLRKYNFSKHPKVRILK